MNERVFFSDVCMSCLFLFFCLDIFSLHPSELLSDSTSVSVFVPLYFFSERQGLSSTLHFLPSFLPPLLSFPLSFFSARLTGAAGGEAAAAAAAVVWSLAAKNGIKSVARRDEELDSLPFLLSLWTRSCFPPEGRG